MKVDREASSVSEVIEDLLKKGNGGDIAPAEDKGVIGVLEDSGLGRGWRDREGGKARH